MRAYAWRRFLRIVPAYWAALTVTGIFIDPAVFERPLLFYGFAQIYSPGAVFQGIPVAWTLCIEVSFYAFLPVFALALRGVCQAHPRLGVARGGGRDGGAVRVRAGLARRSRSPPTARWVQTSVNTLPAYLAWFALGMGLAVTSAWLSEGGAEARVRALRGARAGRLLGGGGARRWR